MPPGGSARAVQRTDAAGAHRAPAGTGVARAGACAACAARVHAARGRYPTVEELALATGKPAAEVAELFSHTEAIRSLDAPLSEDDDRALVEQVAQAEPRPALTERMPNLPVDVCLIGWPLSSPPRQRLVLERRYGLSGEPAQTLAEIAAELGLTRERVRQIQVEALARLRRTANRKGSAEFEWRPLAGQDEGCHGDGSR